ncbi:MAG: metal ABC transporter substrate-binding protein, partial [Anaerolineae bacterium]|nr:metal ABC transporter substrate-binding protein [Anaerolineae bacterium]
MKKWLAAVVLLSLCLVPASLAHGEPLKVVATTTIIADVAQNVGGDNVQVTALIPAEADVHAFEPSPADVARVAEADLVLVNGAGLEAFLGDLVENVAEVELSVVSTGIEVLAGGEHDHGHEEEAHSDEPATTPDPMATAEAKDEHGAEDEHEHAAGEPVGVYGVDAECGELLAHHDDEEHSGEEHSEEEGHDHDHEHGPCDPHFWTDPNNVLIWVDNIAEIFATADPDHADDYRANAAAYKEQLTALDAEVTALLADIPEDRRVIVTNHEFLAYFAHHYGFEVVGVVIPGGTTLAEPDPQALAELVEEINEEGVQAIFAEVSDPGILAQVVATEAGRDIAVVTLYSDSLGAPGGEAGTYLDYVRFNAT